MLKSLTFLVFMLLPAGWLLRDWKYGDKRTKKHPYATKALLVLWLIFGALSTYYYWRQNDENRHLRSTVDELVRGKNELLQNLSDLASQIGTYQEEIRAKDERIVELEKQAHLIRSIEGNIECLVSASWRGGHPGDTVPISWNKAQVYARIFERNLNDSSTVLFSLESIWCCWVRNR